MFFKGYILEIYQIKIQFLQNRCWGVCLKVGLVENVKNLTCGMECICFKTSIKYCRGTNSAVQNIHSIPAKIQIIFTN